MSQDIFRKYFGHPILPAGFNADDIAGDEVDGAGTNWPIWPELFDTFFSYKVMFITEEMMDVFETGCPDYVAPCLPNTVTFPQETPVLVIRRRA
jgi:hypothetical protein